MPRLVSSDDAETLLVFDLVVEATSFWSRLQRGVEEQLTVDAGACWDEPWVRFTATFA